MGTSVPPPGFAGPPQPQPAPPSGSQSSAPPRSRPGFAANRSKLLAGAGVGIVVVVAALAFLLFGSGGTGVGSPIAQAATVSSSAPGFRMHMSLQMTSSALSGPITATGSGVIDLRDHATAMSMNMDLGAEPEVTQQLGGSTLKIEMILVGATAYVKLPSALMSRLPGAAGKWVKVDLAKLSGVPGLSTLRSGPTTSDPSQTLQMLRSVSGGVVDLGRARVDGRQTTHYQAELSASRLIAAFPASERSLAQQALSTLQQAMPSGGFPIDVWIDAHHLVRRVQTTLEMDLPGGQNIQETVMVDLSDYGPQTPPAAPASSDVLDLSNLTGGSSA